MMSDRQRAALQKAIEQLGPEMANRLVSNVPRLRALDFDEDVTVVQTEHGLRAIVAFYDEANDRLIVAGPYTRRELAVAHHSMSRKVTADLN